MILFIFPQLLDSGLRVVSLQVAVLGTDWSL